MNRKKRAKLTGAGQITWAELTGALKDFGYTLKPAGKTGGSRVKYWREREDGTLHVIPLHKPHPAKEIKAYAKQQVCESLREEGLL